MDGYDDNLIKRTLRSLDFSKDNPKLRERLSRELVNRGHMLSDEELDLVSAAGVPDVQKTAVRRNNKNIGEKL